MKLLTNDQGEVIAEYEYDAFGSIVGKSGSAESNYLFTNQEFDNESELYYYNAKYYNPTLGRFISRDPMLGRKGDVLSKNSYIYVKNNPLKYVDPTGEIEEGLWNSFVQNDYVQGMAGYGVGLGEGLWSTVKSVGNMFAHPIDTAIGIGQSVKDTAVGGYDLGKDFYNEPSKTWNEMKTGLGIMYDEWSNDFLDKTPYEQGKYIGFATEKVMEIVVVKKGVDSVRKIVSDTGLNVGKYNIQAHTYPNAGGGGLNIRNAINGDRILGFDIHKFGTNKLPLPHIDGKIFGTKIKHFPWDIFK